MNSVSIDNPFAVQTPEDVPPAEVVDLFVDMFSDYPQIPQTGHTFINGARGSGKSMMFRFLEPDCQLISRKLQATNQLPFFAVYVPIKNSSSNLTEFRRLENQYADLVLAEHILVVYCLVRLFDSLLKTPFVYDEETKALFRTFATKEFRDLLTWAGLSDALADLKGNASIGETLESMRKLFLKFYITSLTYLRAHSLPAPPQPYTGPLLSYVEAFLPIVNGLRKARVIPSGALFLMIDDADNLPLPHTRVLNSWVSTRTSKSVSLKISTQLNYKTYTTATGQLISPPHDFREINLSAIYTSATDKYLGRVRAIVAKRLQRAAINASPEEFFPEYEKQEDEIAEIAKELRERWEKGEGRGYRASDDATRYARPDYIKRLQGTRKAGSTYRYAGFRQLVHLSSGLVRYFLEGAFFMFGEVISAHGNATVLHIPTDIQDKIVREEANKFFFSEFDKLQMDKENEASLDIICKLQNLISGLGNAFHAILVSDLSERRIFSVALSDTPDIELKNVLRLGVQHGYLHETSIGNKDGTGRTKMYVLSRRLAPVFLLDPTSFAGYKFITSAALKEATENPLKFARRYESQGLSKTFEDAQYPLFSDGGVEYGNAE